MTVTIFCVFVIGCLLAFCSGFFIAKAASLMETETKIDIQQKLSELKEYYSHIEFQPGMKVWCIKGKFVNGRPHAQQIVSIDHLRSLEDAEAIFYVDPKYASKTDEDTIGSFKFLTEKEAEKKLREYLKRK